MDGERIVEGIDQVWPGVDLLVCNPAVRRPGNRPRRASRRAFARSPRAARRGWRRRWRRTGAIGLEGGRVVRAPGFPVPVVDTNGAGDVFHGACAIGELRGWPFAWTLLFANAVAAMKCRALGGRRGIPRLPEVAEFLDDRGCRELAAAL